MAGRLVPTGAVCAARVGLCLTTWALEAHSTEAGRGANPVHTGTPIEARGRYTVVNDGLAVGPCVAWRADAGVTQRAGTTGAAIEAGL